MSGACVFEFLVDLKRFWGVGLYSGYGGHPTIIFISSVAGPGTSPGNLYLIYTGRLNVGPIRSVLEGVGVSSRSVRRVDSRFVSVVTLGRRGNSSVSSDSLGSRAFSLNATPTVPSVSFLGGVFNDKSDNGARDSRGARSGGTSGGSGSGGGHGQFVRRCYAGLARGTRGNRVSIVVNHSGRLCHAVRVLSHHSGGGPYLVNRPNINGATVTRKLTLRVTEKRTPTHLLSGRVRLLSLAKLITNARFEKRFRDHMGNLMDRIGRTNGVVLFVSRVRGLINTNSSTRNSVGTTGVLGPTLSHNRVRIVNTAAFGRCEGCVRGSTTLRQEFRPMAIRRPSLTRARGVLVNIGKCCRNFRGMAVPSDVIGGTMVLSRECIASECLPSGTVSLLSRTYTYTDLTGATISRLCGTGGGITRCSVVLRGLRTSIRGPSCRGRTLTEIRLRGCGTLTGRLYRTATAAIMDSVSVTGIVRL